MFKENDVVKLRADKSGTGLVTGAIGTIVMVYRANPVAYEVEFRDEDGVTLALLTLFA